jgi:hypothetical protein
VACVYPGDAERVLDDGERVEDESPALFRIFPFGERVWMNLCELNEHIMRFHCTMQFLFKNVYV